MEKAEDELKRSERDERLAWNDGSGRVETDLFSHRSASVAEFLA